MARSRPWAQTCRRGNVRHERSGGPKTVDANLIDPKIADKEPARCRIERSLMRVGSLLPLRVRTSAFVLHKAGARSQAAVSLNRKARDAAATVVGDDNDRGPPIDREVTRRPTARRNLIEPSQLRPGGPDRECLDATARVPLEVGNFVDRIKKATVRMQGDVGRVGRGGRQRNARQRPGVEIELPV
jgi:hypothetical protein